MAKGDKIPNRAGMNVREGLELLGWDFKVDIKRYPRLKGDELNKAREMKRFATTAATFGLANDNGTPFSGTVRSLLEPTSEPDKWRWSRQRFHVKVFFDFTRSRVDPDAVSKPGLQGHEQGHFDLAQLAARDFCAELLELEPGSLAGMEGFPSSIASRYQRLLDEVDELYDSSAQTFHGSNANQQAIWEAWILDYRLTGAHIESLAQVAGGQALLAK
jgi:hypothetical protein